MPLRHGVLDRRLVQQSTEIIPLSGQSVQTVPFSNIDFTAAYISPANFNCEILVVDSIYLNIRRLSVSSTPGEISIEARIQYVSGFWSTASFLRVSLGEDKNAIGNTESILYQTPVVLMRSANGAVAGSSELRLRMTGPGTGGQIAFFFTYQMHQVPGLAPTTLLNW